MDEPKVVQTQEQVSPTEPVLLEGKPIEPVKPVVMPPALTPEMEAKVQQMIADATAKAVFEAKELGKRELQSQQDRNKTELARAQKRAQLAENVLGSARTHIQTLDPEIAKELELATYRAKEQGRTTMEQEENAAQQQAEFHQNFIGRQTKFITDLGLDPKDKRIDWGSDAKDYLDAMERIQGSVAKLQKENVQAIQSGLEARLKVLEAKVKAEETEANSVETSTSTGVVAGSDVDFMKKFATGDIPMTKANLARREKILEQS